MMIIVARYNSEVCSHHYQIAGSHVVSSEEIISLSAFKIDRNEHVECQSLSNCNVMTKDASVAFQGQAQFNQQMRNVSFRRLAQLAQLDIDGDPACLIDFKRQQISILNDSPFDESFNLEVITGPAIIMLLQHRDIYCLHASCVSISGSINLAFLADSGTGKSTLSRHVDRQWSQQADDIVPISLRGKTVCFESFPQLKLPNALPEAVDFSQAWNPLSALICLSKQPSEQIVISLLSKKDALLAVIRHTVSSRLFDRQAMQAHLEFTKNIIEHLPVYQLSYPRNIQQLPELQSKIKATFA